MSQIIKMNKHPAVKKVKGLNNLPRAIKTNTTDKELDYKKAVFIPKPKQL